MTEVLQRVLVVAFIAAAVVALAALVRKLMVRPSLTTLFAPKNVRRIEIVEQAPVDGKRKLVLIRRDNVEHLVMTGGPVDIVIESGIGATPSAAEPRQAATAQRTVVPLSLAAD